MFPLATGQARFTYAPKGLTRESRHLSFRLRTPFVLGFYLVYPTLPEGQGPALPPGTTRKAPVERSRFEHTSNERFWLEPGQVQEGEHHLGRPSFPSKCSGIFSTLSSQPSSQVISLSESSGLGWFRGVFPHLRSTTTGSPAAGSTHNTECRKGRSTLSHPASVCSRLLTAFSRLSSGNRLRAGKTPTFPSSNHQQDR